MLIDRLRRLLTALWAGMLLAVAGVATPAPFATLAKPEAGRVVAHVLAREAALSLLAAAVLLVLQQRWARQRMDEALPASPPSAMSLEWLLILGALFCTVLGYYALQPMMAAAREGQGSFSFGQLHLASTFFYGLKLGLVLALAWRVQKT